MKKSILFAAAAMSACSSAPISYYGVAPPGRETAYQCAVAQLNILGYTIEDGNSDAGFVRGRRQTSGLGTQILTGNTYHDVLTATAFDNPATGETNLRVVATRIADQDTGLLGALSDEPEQGEDVIAPSGQREGRRPGAARQLWSVRRDDFRGAGWLSAAGSGRPALSIGPLPPKPSAVFSPHLPSGGVNGGGRRCCVACS